MRYFFLGYVALLGMIAQYALADKKIDPYTRPPSHHSEKRSQKSHGVVAGASQQHQSSQNAQLDKLERQTGTSHSNPAKKTPKQNVTLNRQRETTSRGESMNFGHHAQIERPHSAAANKPISKNGRPR